MTLNLNYSVLFIVLLFATHVYAQNFTQPQKLTKSVLTSGGSRTVSLAYLDAQGTLRKTRIQQSIGQTGVVGLSTTALNSVQQGFLSRVKVFAIDNSATEFIKNLDLSMYPNPFKDFINIKFSKPTLFPVTIEVFDIRGRLVLEQQFQPSSLVSFSADRLEDAGKIGIGGVANPQAELHFSNILDNRKLILWQNNSFTNDDHQFYGFGISEGTLRYHVPQVADHVFFGGTSSTTSNELIRIKGTGNVGIGGLGANNIPYTLTVSGTAQVTGAIHDSDGDAGTTGQVLSSTVTGTDWINTTNTITNEMIFDGEDDTSGTYDDYYYISMLINGTDWKVVRYDKTDVNAEAEAMGTGAGNQPITLADCIALTF